MAGSPLGLNPQTLAALGLGQPSGVTGKIMGVLGQPLVQGALGAYLGTIGTPARAGWGRALAQGGLTGLGAFNQAAQRQMQLPLMRATMAEKVAGIEEKGAHAGLLKAETGQYLPPEPELSKQLAIAAQGETDPTLALTKQILSVGLGQGGVKSADAARVLSVAATSGARVALAQAQTLVAKATAGLRQQQQQTEAMKPGEIAAHETEMRAQTAHAQAGTAVEGARLAGTLPPAPEHADVAAEHRANTALAQEKLQRLRASGAEALTPQQQEARRLSIERQANKEGEDAYKALLGTYWMKGHAPEHDKWVADYRNKRIIELGGGGMPSPTAGAGSSVVTPSATVPGPVSVPSRSAAHSAVVRDFGL